MEHKLIAAYLLNPSSASASIDLAKAVPSLAGPLCRRAILLDPAEAMAHFGLAAAAAEKDRAAAGLLLLRTIALAPDFVGGYNNLAALFEHAKQMKTALKLGYRAVLIFPDSPLMHANLGAQLEKSGHGAAAIDSYKRSLVLDPGVVDSVADFATVLSKAGKLAAAKTWFLRAMGLAPDDMRFYRSFLELEGNEPADAVKAKLENVMRSSDALSEEEKINGHFALGKALADSGDTAGAFHQWEEANRIIRATQIYDEAATLGQFAAIEKRFSQAFLDETPDSGVLSDLPVFIVGMPRCGSSMVEQIIASHPAAAGAGEIGDLAKLAEAAGIDKALSGESAPERLESLGQSYLTRLGAAGAGSARITDKMLANFLWLGVIRLALPRAKIIHVKRDPIDSCMSNYSRRFVSPAPYVCDLGRLGRYYRAYSDLMAHWRKVIPDEFLLEVQYEKIVADPKAQIGRILDFINLPWDDRCLEFHRTERLVHTSSRVQVKRPLYSSSVGRWHPYLPYLKPLLDGLGPVAAKI